LLLWAKGDYARAEQLFVRALAINEKTLGPNDPHSNMVRLNLQALHNDEAKAVAK
jgi:hypothetical protein